jgi:hypothetical protein
MEQMIEDGDSYSCVFLGKSSTSSYSEGESCEPIKEGRERVENRLIIEERSEVNDDSQKVDSKQTCESPELPNIQGMVVTNDTPNKKRKVSSRRPPYKPEYMPELRIVKTDIRRQFGKMYVNMVNSQDPQLISKYFYKFCRRDCSFHNYFADGCFMKEMIHSLFPGSTLQHFHGANFARVVDGFIHLLGLLPDLEFRLVNFEVKVRQGVPGSILYCCLECSGSFLYDVHHVNCDTENRQEVPFSAIEFYPPKDPKQKVYLTLNKKPVTITVGLNVIMELDDENQIQSMTSYHISAQSC